MVGFRPYILSQRKFMMNDPFKKLLTSIITLFLPFCIMALEEVTSSSEIFSTLCWATASSPLKCRQYTLYSPKHKLYFVFFAGYTGKNTGKPYDPTDFDFVSIFQNKLEVSALSFDLQAHGRTPQVQHMLNHSFHREVSEEKFNCFSAITITPRAALASYYLKEKHFRSAVYLHKNIKLRLVNGQTKEIKPVFRNIVKPTELSMPFDISKISAEAKNLPQKKLSAKLVKRVENGFLFRTLKNQYYYIRETADGIFLAAFVDDKIVINCKFTNNSVISQLSADGRFVQAFSTFNPFRCEIFFNVPDYSHPLFINVRNDDCKREIFTVNEIKKL